MRCHAKSKQSQEQCRRHAVPGRTVCKIHGGKSPLGPGSASFKHGRYSRVLPVRLAAAYQEATEDPQLLELREAIATVDARIVDLLQRVDSGECGRIWREAQAWMRKFRLEQAKNHVDGMMLAITQLEHLITQGAADYGAWHEVLELLEQRRRLVESEQRRLTMAHEVLNSEQAMTLMATVVDVIKRHVDDRQTLAAIAQEFQVLGHHGNGHPELN